MKKIDILMTIAVGIVFFGTLAITHDTIPEPEPIPETPTSTMSVREQFMKDVAELPDPAEPIEEYWRNTDTFEPTDIVPLSFADQLTLHYVCKVQNVPYAYALGIIESETHFDWDAVGACGEVGIFQVHPVNWDRFEAQGIDVHTHTGNIEAGVMILAECLHEFDEIDKSTMAYKCGMGRAKQLISEGVTSISICDTVSGYTMAWEEMLDEDKRQTP